MAVRREKHAFNYTQLRVIDSERSIYSRGSYSKFITEQDLLQTSNYAGGISIYYYLFMHLYIFYFSDHIMWLLSSFSCHNIYVDTFIQNKIYIQYIFAKVKNTSIITSCCFLKQVGIFDNSFIPKCFIQFSIQTIFNCLL